VQVRCGVTHAKDEDDRCAPAVAGRCSGRHLECRHRCQGWCCRRVYSGRCEGSRRCFDRHCRFEDPGRCAGYHRRLRRGLPLLLSRALVPRCIPPPTGILPRTSPLPRRTLLPPLIHRVPPSSLADKLMLSLTVLAPTPVMSLLVPKMSPLPPRAAPLARVMSPRRAALVRLLTPLLRPTLLPRAL
jgi:hypothetical protein